MIQRRLLLGATFGLLGAAAARAEPSIRLVVGGPPGSSVDQGARTFAPFLERHLGGARVSVVNLPGEVGLTALRAVGAAPADGRTLAWVSTPALPARSVDHRGYEHLLDSIRLVGAVEKEPIAIVSPADGPLASVSELIAKSSENAAALPFATPASGSAPHLAALRLQAVSGTALNIVAFPSAAAARQAAVSGNVAAAMLALGDVVEFLRAGKLTGLGIAASHRAEAFPDMAPLQDAGLRLSAFIERGIAVAAGTPAEAIARIAAALSEVVPDPEFAALGGNGGFKPTWIPADAWTSQTAADRAALVQLWSGAPWLAVGLG